jgi:Ca2+-dependent lipid-binding protein
MGGKDVGRTQVIKNDASPIWNRVIFFPVYRPTALVTLEVFDENTMRADDPLGTVEFQLSSIIETEEETHLARTPLDNWDLLTYKGKQCGLIHYNASFHPLSIPPPSSKDEVAQPATDASEKPKEVAKEHYQWDYSKYSKFLAKVKIHSAKGLPDGNYRAMVCLNSSKVNNYLVSEAQNKSSSTPIFNSSTSVFIPGLTTTQLNVYIQEGKEDRAIDVATWNCMANELVEFIGEKKWVSCRPNGELCVSVDLLPVDYDESVEQFSQTQGRLSINIIEGRNLVAADSGGTSDPYIEIKLNGYKVYKSQVIKKTLNPVYNETSDIPILNSMGSYLRFNVYDWNRLESKDPLGNFSFNVADLTPNEPFEQYFTLKDIAHGEIKLRIIFKPGQLSPEDMRAGYLYVGSGPGIRNTATTTMGSSTFTSQSANKPIYSPAPALSPNDNTTSSKNRLFQYLTETLSGWQYPTKNPLSSEASTLAWNQLVQLTIST